MPRPPVHHESCRITGHASGLDMARLIPKVCDSWFSSNYMREYASNTIHNNALDDAPNRLPLRTDIHRFLDRSYLTIVPKPNSKDSPSATRSYTLTTHILRPTNRSIYANVEMISLYHNLKVHPLNGNPIEYAFARFAWNLFVDTILLLFQNKNMTTRTMFYISVSERSEETMERQLEHKEFKGNPPLPRAWKKEKPHSRKRSWSEMARDDVDSTGDTESVDSYGSTAYDAYFEDIYRECYDNGSEYLYSEYDDNGSDTYSPRNRSRSSSPDSSE
ncbi:uncharacterized protein F4812DRAFT_223807 [Daldinia caldariorum]|uniref:uncharacterized protein n=1 Tax=Daldinia caldariorum TaxID=326644 RepID=UPI0020081295|nr:uncharacterized protein F4812DRAFT_223807 [Daldinia caldariorum]KAI1464102.1 hypothetical protein F4812DRAFT_223807 [Daldinia caldariorum]